MRLLLAFFFSLLLVLPAWAQERVRNVRLQIIDESQLEIQYDLIEIHPGDSVYLGVESRLKGPLQLLPEFIRGDVGRRVTAGPNRRIVWNAVANGYALNEDVRATILVKAVPLIRPDQAAMAEQKLKDQATTIGATSSASQPGTRTDPVKQPAERDRTAVEPDDQIRSRKTRYAGPAWALVSAVAPGIGNIFVQMPKPKIGLRPLLTVGCYGLVAYGLSERQKSLDEYAIYEQQKNIAAGEPYYQTANSHHHAYFLATRGAVVVAAVDVVLTFVKGLRNNRLQKGDQRFKAVTVWPGLQAGQPTAIIHYSF